jgi:MFS family permease
VFYGWYIVAAGALLMACYSGIIVYGFTAFIEPIALTFGWSLTQISLATSLRGLESGALNPLVGILVDRYPARQLSLIGMVIFAMGLFCISRVTSLAMFYVGFLIIGVGSSIAIHMIPQTSVVRWFRRDVGKASGVLFMGNGLGGLFVPGIIMLIDLCGWQSALLLLSGGILALGIPLSFLYRESPEDHGLLPGGKTKEGSPGAGFSGVSDYGMGVKEALRTRAFWQIGAATTLQMAGVMAVITHIMPYLSSIGVERSVSGKVAMSIPVVSLLSRIPFGWLCDIFDKRHVLASSIGLGSIGFFLLWLIDPGSYGLITLFVVFMGLGIGGVMPPRLPIYGEYFGIRNFGKIFGLASIFFTLGIMGGPPLAGWVYDTLGVFDPFWLVMSGANVIGVIIILTTPPAFRDPGRRAGRPGSR